MLRDELFFQLYFCVCVFHLVRAGEQEFFKSPRFRVIIFVFAREMEEIS